jgi:hypothetical protein
MHEYRVLARRPRAPLRADRVLHHASPIDRDLLAVCASLVVGEHDFGAFTPTATPGERRLRHVTSCAWRADGDELVLEIEADAFLHHMVRSLVGTMLQVARHARSVDSFARLLGGASRELAGPTAPAHALTLSDVRYAGDVPDGDHIRCYVTRERAGARELLVLERDAGATLPDAVFERFERVDLAARRAVRVLTGVDLDGVPRPLGMTCEADRRVCAVWLQAPPDTDDRWLHRPEHAAAAVTCRFASLTGPLPLERSPQLERLVAAH